MESGGFVTAMVHLYRAELTRVNAARSRLDVTTNWAVVATGAAISFAFGEPTTHHSVIIMMTVLVSLFLLLETRRYRYYALWSYRVRLIETHFFAAMLTPPFKPGANWSKDLAKSLLNPEFPLSFMGAFGERLRRNYEWIYLILGLAWLAKLLLYPEGVRSIAEVFEHARMGVVHGWVVITLQVVFYLTLFIIGGVTYNRRSDSEIVRSKLQEVKDMAAQISDNQEKNENIHDG
jgi:uncharacterized membrane protein